MLACLGLGASALGAYYALKPTSTDNQDNFTDAARIVHVIFYITMFSQ